MCLIELSPFPEKTDREVGVDKIFFRDDFWEMLEKAEKENKVFFRFPTLQRRTIDIEVEDNG